MVFRKETLVVVISVTAVLWIQTASMRPEVSKKKLSKEGNKEQEVLFKCYNEINCVLDPEYYEEMDSKCYCKTIQQDVELIAKFLTDAEYNTDAKNFRELMNFFCPHEMDPKRKIFETASNKLVSHTSKICASDKKEDCDRLEKFLKCVGTLIQTHNEAGNCGK